MCTNRQHDRKPIEEGCRSTGSFTNHCPKTAFGGSADLAVLIPMPFRNLGATPRVLTIQLLKEILIGRLNAEAETGRTGVIQRINAA
jgi:hypothetical protein